MEGTYTLKGEIYNLSNEVIIATQYQTAHTVDFDDPDFCTDTCTPPTTGSLGGVEGGVCCGADAFANCGITANQKICGIYGENWQWENLSAITGTIKTLTCSDDKFVVDENNDVFRCGPVPGTLLQAEEIIPEQTDPGMGAITGLGMVDITGAVIVGDSCSCPTVVETCDIIVDGTASTCVCNGWYAGLTLFGIQIPASCLETYQITDVFPTCTDTGINQDETDLNCGGLNCDPCLDGKACRVQADCQSGHCYDGTCLVAPHCDDGIKNQDEDEVDCGGVCEPCSLGLSISSIPLTKTTINNFRKTHQFLCYSEPQVGGGISYNIMECVGNDALSLGDYPNSVYAQTGADILGNLIWQHGGTGSGIVLTGIPMNITSKGIILFDIEPDGWDGDDGQEHWLFFYGDPNDLTKNYLAIAKTGDNKLRCEANSGVWVDDGGSYVSTWEDGGTYQVGISWNSATSTMKCWGNGILATSFSLPSLPGTEQIWLGGAPLGSRAEAEISNVKMYSETTRQVYFCTKEATWDPDLDTDDQETCEAAQLIWTGSKCCSEPEDISESYNDPGYMDNPDIQYRGGCWEDNYVQAGTFVGSGNSILNYQGNFVGCNIPPGDRIRDKLDTHTRGNVITNYYDSQSCVVLPEALGVAGAICLGDGWETWFETEEAGLKTKPAASPGTESGCCAVSSCWNGTTCVADQIQEASLETQYGKRCIAGDWITASPKKTWTRANLGFCAQESSCLVNPDTGEAEFNGQPQEYFNNNIPQCIYDEQYIGPFYCENGNWGSRTKLIALQLLDFLEINYPTDYDLFCGNYDEFLNFYGYEAFPGGGAVSSYIGDACSNPEIDGCVNEYVNEFCGIKYGPTVGFGVSLNIPIDDPNSFLKALGKDPDFCNGAKNNDGDYDTCGEVIFYNHNTESLIYLPIGSLGAANAQQLLSARGPILINKLNEVITFAEGRVWTLSEAIIDKLYGGTNQFRKIYYAKHDGQELFAFLEEAQAVYIDETNWFGPANYMGLHYSDFSVTDIFGTDACNLIQNLFVGLDWQQCLYDAGEMHYAVVYYPTDPLGQQVSASWSDFTSKLRP